MKRIIFILQLFLSIKILSTDSCKKELPKNIVIRMAESSDLPSLSEFDKAVSFEYFVPLYKKGYSHLPIGQNPEHYLTLEIEQDKVWFPQCIAGKNDDSLIIAHDTAHKAIAGLIIVHKSNLTLLEIELLLVAKKYRGCGIGKALFQYALSQNPAITHCHVYPLRFANDSTLAFYQALGFDNCGISQLSKLIHGIRHSDLYFFYAYRLEKTNAV